MRPLTAALRMPTRMQARERVKHLTIAIAQTAYLMLPASGRLVPGHCQIAAIEHAPSSRAVDDHVWTEMRNFKKCLLQVWPAARPRWACG